MSAMSDYLENNLVMHIFRSNSWSKPSALAIALCTAATADDDDGSTITEVANSNNYSRVAVNPSDATWDNTDGSNGVTANSSDITFPTASGSWGTISHIAICDSATWGAGNVIFHGALTTPKDVGSGDTFVISAGNLTITLA